MHNIITNRFCTPNCRYQTSIIEQPKPANEPDCNNKKTADIM